MKNTTRSLIAVATALMLGLSTAYASTNSSPSSSGVTVKVGKPLSVKQLQNYICLVAAYTVKHPPERESFDTSGFVQYIYSKIGIKLPRTILDQSKIGKEIRNRGQLQKGDLVFYNLSNSSRSQVTFDGIYIGRGLFVALTTHGIEAVPMQSQYWRNKFRYGVRIL